MTPHGRNIPLFAENSLSGKLYQLAPTGASDSRPLEQAEMYNLPISNHSRMPSMTMEYAHSVMQMHLECSISICPIKAQAKRQLIDVGRLVPADAPHVGS